MTAATSTTQMLPLSCGHEVYAAYHRSRRPGDTIFCRPCKDFVKVERNSRSIHTDSVPGDLVEQQAEPNGHGFVSVRVQFRDRMIVEQNARGIWLEQYDWCGALQKKQRLLAGPVRIASVLMRYGHPTEYRVCWGKDEVFKGSLAAFTDKVINHRWKSSPKRHRAKSPDRKIAAVQALVAELLKAR